MVRSPEWSFVVSQVCCLKTGQMLVPIYIVYWCCKVIFLAIRLFLFQETKPKNHIPAVEQLTWQMPLFTLKIPAHSLFQMEEPKRFI